MLTAKFPPKDERQMRKEQEELHRTLHTAAAAAVVAVIACARSGWHAAQASSSR